MPNWLTGISGPLDFYGFRYHSRSVLLLRIWPTVATAVGLSVGYP